MTRRTVLARVVIVGFVVAMLTLAHAPIRAQEPGKSNSASAQPPVAVPGTAHQHLSEHEIHLDKSFEVPHENGKRATHSPCVVFTKDGKRMVTATSEGEIVEFDAPSRKILRRFKLPAVVTSAISIDPAARTAVAVLAESVAVIDIPSGKTLTLNKQLQAKWAAISPDGKQVALTRNQQLEIRNVPELKLQQTIPGHQVEITNVAWSADGKYVGATAQDGRLIVSDVARKRPIYEVKKAEALHALAFDPQNRFVAYGGNDRQVYQYAFQSEKEEVISQNQPYWITCLGYSPNGAIIAVGDESCDIWLYDRQKRELLFHNKHHVECWLSGVGWAPDSETFLFGCRPNSHAGQPAIYTPLAVAEAAQAKEVSNRREALVQAIDKQLKATTDEQQRRTLQTYRDSLLGQTKLTNLAISAAGSAGLVGMPGLGMPGFGGFGGGGFGENAAGFPGGIVSPGQADYALPGSGGASSDSIAGTAIPNSANLSPELQKLADDYSHSLQQEVVRLNANHCINQWKVRRSK